MKIVTKLVAASVLALSVAAPAFAAEETTLLDRNTYVSHAAIDALAYVPARTPAAAKTLAVHNFGIGSQS